jgi:hypothetical protein
MWDFGEVSAHWFFHDCVADISTVASKSHIDGVPCLAYVLKLAFLTRYYVDSIGGLAVVVTHDGQF